MKKYMLTLLAMMLVCGEASARFMSSEKGLVVVGLGQQGEGATKVIQYLVKPGDISVRSQGACAAGHTVKITVDVCGGCSAVKKTSDQKQAPVIMASKQQKEVTITLHMVPVGIVVTGVKCYMTGGMFIDPEKLFQEIDMLQKYGISLENTLRISSNVHIIFPYHKELDRLAQKHGKTRIGKDMVLSGARACAADKRCGIGIRLGDLVSPEFPQLLKMAVENANAIITKVYNEPALDYAKILKTYSTYIKRFESFIRDKVEVKINKLLLTGSRVIFEGSHGTFLDISHGCYPAVSAESTTASGICAAAGVGPTRIAHTLGVAKVYGTHLGDGPFPTEIKDPQIVSHFQQRYGSCCPGSKVKYGWLDIVQIRQAALLNGVNSVVLTRIDELDGLKEIKICTHYELDGKPLYDVPPQISDLKRVMPMYHTIKGWKGSLQECRKFTDLPEEARIFIKTIEHVTGVIVSHISVGPDKDQTIELVSHLLPRPSC